MAKILLALLLGFISAQAMAEITDQEVDLLNNHFSPSVAHKVQLGTLIQNAEEATPTMPELDEGYIFVGDGDDVAAGVEPSGDIAVSTAGVFSIVTESIVNLDIDPTAAIDLDKLEPMAEGTIVVGSAAEVPTETAVTGDVTISGTGVTAIGASKVLTGMIAVDTIAAVDIAAGGVATSEILDATILDADVSASAAIATSKLAGYNHTTEGLDKVERMAIVDYTFADEAGDVGTVGLGTTLPDNAIVTKVVQDIYVDCDSTADTGTITLVLPTDGDLSAATTCDNTNAGLLSTLPSGTPVKLTAARELSVTIATNAVLVGSIRWFVYYVIGL